MNEAEKLEIEDRAFRVFRTRHLRNAANLLWRIAGDMKDEGGLGSPSDLVAQAAEELFGVIHTLENLENEECSIKWL